MPANKPLIVRIALFSVVVVMVQFDTLVVSVVFQLPALAKSTSMKIHPRGFVASLVLLLSVVRPLQAEVLFHIYAPSPDEKKVLVVRATKAEGGLSLQKVQDVEIGFPVSTITRHPSKPVLYVAPPSGGEGQARGALLGLKMDGTADVPVPFNFQHPSAYLKVDRSEKFLMSADYGSGCVDVYSMDDAGLALKLASTTNEGRKLAHCIATTPDNQFAYVSYVKETNAIFQYRLDAASGKLSALAPHNAEPPAGTGPRHMAFHPTKPILYFSNEQHLGVSAYNVHPNGQLSVRQIVDCLPKDQPKDGISSSDIVTTPDGKYLFAGIRGHTKPSDYISRYRIEPSGDLVFLGLTPSDKIPWGFAFSPDAQFLLVTAFEGATLTAFTVTTDGNLTPAGSLAWGKKISSITTR